MFYFDTEWTSNYKCPKMFICSSMPKESDIRQGWIEAIGEHQKVECQGVSFYMICELHFHPKNLKRLKTKIELRKGTIPTIFPIRLQCVTTCNVNVPYMDNI